MYFLFLVEMASVLRCANEAQYFIGMVTALWAIWTARRIAIHESEFQPSLSTHLFVKNFISDLETTYKQPHKTAPACTTGHRRMPWISSPEGLTKFNVDGATSRNWDVGAIVAACRNRNDTYLGSSVITFSGITEASILSL